MAEVCELNIYPVKSLKGITLEESILGVKGLAYDRNWMIVNTDGEFITQRLLSKMATVNVSLTDKELVLQTKEAESFSIPLKSESSESIEVKIWSDTCHAIDEGDEISKWLTSVLGTYKDFDLRLVRFSDSFVRHVEPTYLQGNHANTAFADGYPYLVTSVESLETLNKKLKASDAQPVTMDRFRPNIVLKGVKPFEEDKIASIISKDESYQLDLRKPCQRCVITTIDQNTGESPEPKEPLKTLVSMNPFVDLKGAYFGQNAILIDGDDELIRVGDKVKLVKAEA